MVLSIFFKDFIFIYLTEREREITSRQRGRQREWGKQAPRRAESLMGARSQDSEIMT